MRFGSVGPFSTDRLWSMLQIAADRITLDMPEKSDLIAAMKAAVPFEAELMAQSVD